MSWVGWEVGWEVDFEFEFEFEFDDDGRNGNGEWGLGLGLRKVRSGLVVCFFVSSFCFSLFFVSILGVCSVF